MADPRAVVSVFNGLQAGSQHGYEESMRLYNSLYTRTYPVCILCNVCVNSPMSVARSFLLRHSANDGSRFAQREV